MTLVNQATGEVVAAITVADVDASIARVLDHAESIWDEWAWQVENRTWVVKGFASWDEMRTAVYGGLSGVTAPRAERPELIARFRQAGLTQRETAATLGVAVPTVKRAEHPEWKGSNDPLPSDAAVYEPDMQVLVHEDVIDVEVVEDEPARPVLTSRAFHEADLINSFSAIIRTTFTPGHVNQLSDAARQKLIHLLSNAIETLEGSSK